MLVREIMTTPALTVGAAERPQDAMQLMATVHVTMLPVVDDLGLLVGVLSEADLLRPALGPDSRAHLQPSGHEGVPLPRKVSELMTAPAHTVAEETDVAAGGVGRGVAAAGDQERQEQGRGRRPAAAPRSAAQCL